MRRETPVTVRVPTELKDRVDTLASEIGISSAAVWKILLHRSVKPLLDGDGFQALDIFREDPQSRTLPVSSPEPSRLTPEGRGRGGGAGRSRDPR